MKGPVMSKENSPPVHLHCHLAQENIGVKLTTLGRVKTHNLLCRKAAKHRKTKVAGKSGQIAQPLTQLQTLPTAWY